MVEERTLLGKRVILAVSDPDMPELVQYVRDYRAASEVFTEGGRAYVRVIREVAWYAWTTDPNPAKTPAPPRAKVWPADLVWVE